ncbi:hypothetical protein VP01_2651g1 [Puccinia sorghi]|uniref:Uncharacterized protein n=1 Tax=Puccinia sorghi TaxID=27349 RepID=A0A0L6V463_9BASI|nr:hypothetical protein VP01_2651g1 [Puccinia sorghi]
MAHKALSLCVSAIALDEKKTSNFGTRVKYCQNADRSNETFYVAMSTETAKSTNSIFQSDNVQIFMLNQHLLRLANHARLSFLTNSWASSTSSNVEFLAQGLQIVQSPENKSPIPSCGPPPFSVNWSPVCKPLRSPAGEGVAHTLSRLHFECNCLPKHDQHSLKQNFPTSGGSSYAHSSTHSPSIIMDRAPRPDHTQDLCPLTTTGQAMLMNEFLDFCNFAHGGMMPHGLIDLAHIRNWSYFQETGTMSLVLTHVVDLIGQGTEAGLSSSSCC